MMLKTRLLLMGSLAFATSALLMCKSARSSKLTDITGGSIERITTEELRTYLDEKIAAQRAATNTDDGSNPSGDIWDFYIDPIAASKNLGVAIADHRSFFGVPLADLKVCHPRNKVHVEGVEKCMAYDNLLRYAAKLDGSGEILSDPKDWYTHIIPQRFGSNQPEMLKYIKEGDIIVYWHPERRDDAFGTVLQWRTTHAATIMERRLSGSDNKSELLTVDTPAGYAKPFNGADDTPFHVFRFVPRGFDGNWQVLDTYRQQVARWGTLAFNKFLFQGSYDVMAKDLRIPADIDKFADNYIRAGNTAGPGSVLPKMYCAWYTFMNLNLAWMRPFSPEGLGMPRYASLVGKRFQAVNPGHSYANGEFNTGYRVPESLQPNFAAQQEFAFAPLTAPDLIAGFLDRIVGPDRPIEQPEIFVGVAKQKAGILAPMAEDAMILKNFQIEPNPNAPMPTEKQTLYNQKVKETFTEMAGLYNHLADSVASGSISVADAKGQILEKIETLIRKEWTDTLNYSKKWIPPYGFMRHAEFHDSYYASGEQLQRPILVYVGTVIHEKFLRDKGQAPGTKIMKAVPSATLTDMDKALDRSIYEVLGCEVKDDGNGYLELMKHLEPGSTYRCGPAEAVSEVVKERFNAAEFAAIKSMEKDWIANESLSQRSIFIRNTFGLDPILMRRLMVSWWNDPTQQFKPAIYEGESATMDTAIKNLRLLLQDPITTMNATQAALNMYNEVGHPRRTSPLNCLLRAAAHKPSCGAKIQDFDDTAPELVNNPDFAPQ